MITKDQESEIYDHINYTIKHYLRKRIKSACWLELLKITEQYLADCDSHSIKPNVPPFIYQYAGVEYTPLKHLFDTCIGALDDFRRNFNRYPIYSSIFGHELMKVVETMGVSREDIFEEAIIKHCFDETYPSVFNHFCNFSPKYIECIMFEFRDKYEKEHNVRFTK